MNIIKLVFCGEISEFQHQEAQNYLKTSNCRKLQKRDYRKIRKLSYKSSKCPIHNSSCSFLRITEDETLLFCINTLKPILTSKLFSNTLNYPHKYYIPSAYKF